MERGGGTSSSYSWPSRARHTPKDFLSLHGHSPKPQPLRAGAPRRPTRWRGGTVAKPSGLFPALRTKWTVVANSSPDSVLEAFRRKSGGLSPAPLASPPGAAPSARSCGSSRTEQDCSGNDQRNNSRVKLTWPATARKVVTLGKHVHQKVTFFLGELNSPLDL